jgi:glycosyltransferase involved in cell wall biosynthesis
LSKELHIVCLDCPSPPDYGGAIDMFYRIKALHDLGNQIHLHYFSYNDRQPNDELLKYCMSVNAYKRTKGGESFFSRLPYIVSSRINQNLINNLNKDKLPVLLEGVHTTGIMSRLNAGRKIVVRLHNDEHEYYRQLSVSTRNLLKKFYYIRESRLLKKYQHSLPGDCIYACITEKDTAAFRNEYGLAHVFFLPPFTPFNTINSEEGMGDYCLYHGNLSVAENEKAALWLIKEVFSRIKTKLVIAGKGPSIKLRKTIRRQDHISLVADPDEDTMNGLVQKAHINVLPSFSTTGSKLKLMHALLAGRHCLVNEKMASGTGLEAACHTGTHPGAFASIILQLMHQPFTGEEIMLRKKLVLPMLNNRSNTLQLMRYL